MWAPLIPLGGLERTCGRAPGLVQRSYQHRHHAVAEHDQDEGP
jgi:hypothetical protein